MDEDDLRRVALAAAEHLTGHPPSTVNTPQDIVAAAVLFLAFLSPPEPIAPPVAPDPPQED